MALAAAFLHVFFLSLHVAASAAYAMAGSEAGQRLAFLICAPAQSFQTALEANDSGSTDAGGAPSLTCPYCTSAAAAPAALLPELPAVPAYLALEIAPLPPRDIGPATPQHGLSLKRSRAPPHTA